MGSYDVRMYASQNLKTVAGIVLVDPSADNQIERMTAVGPQARGAAEGLLRHPQPLRRTGDGGDADAGDQGLRPAARPRRAARAARLGPRAPGAAQLHHGVRSELDSFNTLDTPQLLKVRRPLGDIPLVVLTGKPTAPGATAAETDAVYKVWITMHDEMAALSTRGENRIVAGAGHYIQHEKPAVVVAAVQEVVEAVRAKRR